MPDVTLHNFLSVLFFAFFGGFAWTVGAKIAGKLFGD